MAWAIRMDFGRVYQRAVWSAQAMLALFLPKAVLWVNCRQSHASSEKGGSVTPALQGLKTVLLFIVLMTFWPFSVVANGKGQPLSQERVVETVRHYVLERSAWRPDQVEVLLRSFSPPTLPEGEVELTVLKPTRGVTPGLRRFLVAVHVNGREEARLWVDSDVQVFEEVVVTSQSLAHYEAVTPDKVRLERRNLSETPLLPLTALAALEGRQASRSLEVNQVVTAAMVDLPRVIRRGSVVTMVYESAGLYVETPGRAAEPGRVGDRIRVENPSSGKMLEGQILDDRRVRMN